MRCVKCSKKFPLFTTSYFFKRKNICRHCSKELVVVNLKVIRILFIIYIFVGAASLYLIVDIYNHSYLWSAVVVLVLSVIDFITFQIAAKLK